MKNPPEYHFSYKKRRGDIIFLYEKQGEEIVLSTCFFPSGQGTENGGKCPSGYIQFINARCV